MILVHEMIKWLETDSNQDKKVMLFDGDVSSVIGVVKCNEDFLGDAIEIQSVNRHKGMIKKDIEVHTQCLSIKDFISILKCYDDKAIIRAHSGSLSYIAQFVDDIYDEEIPNIMGIFSVYHQCCF